MKGIYEMAILGRITWNLHSLNNEGTVGNVTEPRNVRIIDPNTGDAITTDGISGEMLKHIHAAYMWRMGKKSKFCAGCKKLEPERSFKDKAIKSKRNFSEIEKEAIKKCILCDCHGFLFPEAAITGSRSSIVDFGWALGLPKNGEFIRDIHLHTRVAPSKKSKSMVASGEKGKKGEITTQMIYHRPTRSGSYAVISLFQPWRIGLNRADMKYVISNGDRKERYELILKAYQAMFMRTEGAMISTRLPHTTDFLGIIILAKTNIPVPVISPLKKDYIDKVKEILSRKSFADNFELVKFNSVSEYVGVLESLLEKTPYSIY